MQPAPPAPYKYWLILQKEENWSFTGKTITLRTDVHCHLWMHYSEQPPGRHDRMTMRRGLAEWNDPHWGFEEWAEIDQAEHGDTLLHTFTIDPWPVGVAYWYCFIGNIAGEASASVSPWWKQEEALLPPPAWQLIFEEPWTE